MLRRLGIRGKVLAALAVPVLVLFCAASLISVESIQSSRVARAVNDLVGVSDEIGNFTRALQVERADTLAYLADPEAPRVALYAARKTTDTTSAQLSVAMSKIDVTVLGPKVVEYLGLLKAARDTVPALPIRFDYTGTIPAAVVDAQYTSIIDLHVQTARVVSDALTDRSLAQYLYAYGLTGEAREGLIHELPAADQAVAPRRADPAGCRSLRVQYG